MFPSGCHRHPSKIMVARPLVYNRPSPAQLLSYRNYSDYTDHSLNLNTRENNVSYLHSTVMYLSMISMIDKLKHLIFNQIIISDLFTQT